MSSWESAILVVLLGYVTTHPHIHTNTHTHLHTNTHTYAHTHTLTHTLSLFYTQKSPTHTRTRSRAHAHESHNTLRRVGYGKYSQSLVEGKNSQSFVMSCQGGNRKRGFLESLFIQEYLWFMIEVGIGDGLQNGSGVTNYRETKPSKKNAFSFEHSLYFGQHTKHRAKKETTLGKTPVPWSAVNRYP